MTEGAFPKARGPEFDLWDSHGRWREPLFKVISDFCIYAALPPPQLINSEINEKNGPLTHDISTSDPRTTAQSERKKIPTVHNLTDVKLSGRKLMANQGWERAAMRKQGWDTGGWLEIVGADSVGDEDALQLYAGYIIFECSLNYAQRSL